MKRYWTELVPRGHAYHISAALDDHRMPIALHDHDFAEVMWVTKGSGLHRINGSLVEMAPGDLAFIRPADRHGLSARHGKRFCLENVAFSRAALQRLYRVCVRCERDWFWRSGALPMMFRLDGGQRERLAGEIEWLRGAPRDQIALETFLLNLLRLLGVREAHADNLPDWLRAAISKFSSPADLPGGVRRLCELAGRCPEHVARTMRKHAGLTPSAWVNLRRLDHAARLLESGFLPVTEVAAVCGFENLSHFHRLFRRQYGVTPLRHRARRHAIM